MTGNDMLIALQWILKTTINMPTLGQSQGSKFVSHRAVKVNCVLSIQNQTNYLPISLFSQTQI